VLVFLTKLIGEVGQKYSESDLKNWVWEHLKSGQVKNYCIVLKDHE
jgi:citrate synthase